MSDVETEAIEAIEVIVTAVVLDPQAIEAPASLAARGM